MYIPAFPVNTTNIFPVANSTAGGQLLSEFNLRSRESVITDSNVEYVIGPSYTHSDDDFKVTYDSTISSTLFTISSGRALVNGHYVESLADISIDMSDLNAYLIAEGGTPLKGDLGIGLKIAYSTEQTMAGSMKPEDDTTGIYQGVGVVVLPIEEFLSPSDTPDDQSLVTVHLKLGTFTYRNDTIGNLVENANKSKAISADRIGDLEGMLDNTYVTRTGLDPNKLYVFSGDDQSNWCQAMDSLITWNANPNKGTTVPESNVARFDNTTQDGVRLYLPSKQPDQPIYDTDHHRLYWQPTNLQLPNANYQTGAAGVVNSTYTNIIKDIDRRVQDIYNLGTLTGSLKGFLPVLYADDDSVSSTDPLKFPKIEDLSNPSLFNIVNWLRGDYILVGQDRHAMVSTEATPSSPSTMYVIAGKIIKGGTPPSYQSTRPSGIMLDRRDYVTDDDTFESNSVVWADLGITSVGSNYCGEENDYFMVTHTNTSTSNVQVKYLKVGSVHLGDTDWIRTDTVPRLPQAYWLTGGVPFAQEDVVGGFYNVPETALGEGYVMRDASGHLKMLDYDLLVTGVLAYQLGEDFTVPAGVTSIADIQPILDNYVNQRVAFANANHQATATDPSTIHVYITLEKESSQSVLYIQDIDSRFNTSVYIHFLGEADSNTVIYVQNCERVRLDFSGVNMCNNPLILRIINCCLYYDSSILDMAVDILGLSLWYDGTDLMVNGLNVDLIATPQSIQSFGDWSSDTPNDNHFIYALKGLTFASNGMIEGCKLLVGNCSTANVYEGDQIFVESFELPQTGDLMYPASRLIKPIKVTGSFVTAYPLSTTTPEGYVVMNTSFTALSQTFSDPTCGTISALMTSKYIYTNGTPEIPSTENITGWLPNEFNVFEGGVFD